MGRSQYKCQGNMLLVQLHILTSAQGHRFAYSKWQHSLPVSAPLSCKCGQLQIPKLITEHYTYIQGHMA
jgi:hypothetical protein